MGVCVYMPMADNQYLTIQEVAKRFSVTASTIYRLAQRGVLPGLKVGGQWRFSEAALESWAVDRMTAARLNAERLRGGRAPRKEPE